MKQQLGRRWVVLLGLRAVAVLIVLCLACLWSVAVVTPARAQERAPSPVTWTVGPANASGPTGKTWVELELDPGVSVQAYLAVRNLGDREVTFSINAADGYLTDKGRFNMLPAGTRSVAAGTWISVQKQVTVPAGGTAVVPFAVTVPENATPGDHAAGIAASISSQGAQQGTAVTVESRIGFRVMTRVAGVIKPELSVVSRGNFDTNWNPFAPGSGTVDVVLENQGNVRLNVGIDAPNSTQTAADAKTGEAPTHELMPGDKRTVTLRMPAVWPLGAVTIPVTVEKRVVAASGGVQGLEQEIHTTTFWALPWPQLIVLFAVGLMLAGLFAGQRRRKKNVRLLVEQAREMGRREAGLEINN